MQYHISKAKSAEYLRLAIQKMVMQQAALHPVSYALWYEYVSGQHQRLQAAVDAELAEKHSLDEAATARLFRQHLLEANADEAREVISKIDTIMQTMQHTAGETGIHAGSFRTALTDWTTHAQSQRDINQETLDSLLGHSSQLLQALTDMEQQLGESARQIAQLKADITRSREDSMLDSLTGLMTREHFEVALSECLTGLSTPEASSTSTCLLMMDIDYLERVNDSHGALFGDKVIQAVADIIRHYPHQTQIAARYDTGGFIVLLPSTALADAEDTAEMLRKQIAAMRIEHTYTAKRIGEITVSLGMTSYAHGEAGDSFIARAQQALNASKAKGRNQLTSLRH